MKWTLRRAVAASRATSCLIAAWLCSPAVASEAWSYSTIKDEMRGTITHVAEINSTTRLRDGLRGPVALTILVRRPMAGRDDDVMLVLRNGQFGCGVTDCVATVKFGEATPKPYALTRSADMATHAVFVERAREFVAQMSKASAIIAEVDVFRAGRQQFHFTLPPLSLPERSKRKN